MRILIISNLYPDSRQPTFGTFIAEREAALRAAGQTVDLLAIRGHSAGSAVARKYASLTLRIAWWILRAVVRGRRPDIVEAHIAFPTALLALPAARLTGARLVAFAHGADVRKVGRRTSLHRRLARWVLRRADLVVANSPSTRALLTSVFQVLPDRIAEWSPGVDMTTFRPGPEPSRVAREVLYVGRLHPEKGVHILIDAVGRLVPDGVTLRVIGDGPAEPELRRLAAEQQVPTRFEGPASREGVASAMGQAGVVAVPSVVPEGLGLVAVEAMATGAFVVASATGGLTDTIRDGENGWLVPPGDAAALATALASAIILGERGGPVAERIRQAARTTAAAHDQARMIASAVTFYSDFGREIRTSGGAT